jgi:hypothetical protein
MRKIRVLQRPLRVQKDARRCKGRESPALCATSIRRFAAPANINLLHAVSKAKQDDVQKSDFHDKFTASRNDFGSDLPFAVNFEHCAGQRLFPVQFVTEW